MKDLHGPQTQVVEGAYAIKVSMSCSCVLRLLLYYTQCARTIYLIMIIKENCHMNQRLACYVNSVTTWAFSKLFLGESSFRPTSIG